MRLWVRVSDMGLEERCDDEDMHVSTARIPIVQEHPLDISEGDSLEDSRIMQAIPGEQPTPENQLPRTIYAPLGDAEFWFGIHLGLVEYALRAAGQSMHDKNLAEARINLIQNDLYRQFTDKMHINSELVAQKELNEKEKKTHISQLAFVFAKYIDLVYAMGIAQDRHETTIQELEKMQDLRLQFYRLCASNEIERKENVIKMYEERFGSREELEKLAQAEENTKLPGTLGPRKYADISALIKQHETGERPKTVGQRMADFAEKLLSPKTYSNIVNALYAAFRGKEQRDDSCG